MSCFFVIVITPPSVKIDATGRRFVPPLMRMVVRHSMLLMKSTAGRLSICVGSFNRVSRFQRTSLVTCAVIDAGQDVVRIRQKPSPPEVVLRSTSARSLRVKGRGSSAEEVGENSVDPALPPSVTNAGTAVVKS
jgi:hypothetical protein